MATIPFCKDFWDDVLSKVSRFYLTWMLPLIFEEITSTPCIDAITAEVAKKETTPCNDVAPTELIQEEFSRCNEAPTEVVEDKNTPCNDAVTTDSPPVKYGPDLPIKSDLISIVSTSSEAQKVLSNILGIPLFEDDLTCLLDNEKLNDTIVVIFTRKLMIESPHLKNVILPDSIFYLSLSQNSPNITQCERFKRASRFVKTLGLQDTLVVPICENDHWYVIVINSSYAIVMDSLSIHVLTRNKQISLISKFLNWRNPDVVYAKKRYCLLKFPNKLIQLTVVSI